MTPSTDTSSERVDEWAKEAGRLAGQLATAQSALAAEVQRREAAEAERDRFKAALPACVHCGGSGKIEEAARLSGPNIHSACVGTCHHCDGLGVEL